MRKYVTAAATALTIGVLSFATPAMADQFQLHPGNPGQYQAGNQQYGNPGYGNQGYGNQGYGGQQGYDRNDDGYRRDDRGGYRGRDRDYDWNGQERNFDRWENGWRRGNWENDRHGAALPYWRLVRKLEQQGYRGIRGLRESRYGWGLRAFAYNYRGLPVMLRINPYNGRVIDVRVI